jgi:hypothetical protein
MLYFILKKQKKETYSIDKGGYRCMYSQIWKLLREHLALTIKCGSVFSLFLVSLLIVACGANNTAAVPGAPPVTVTINLNQSFASPTPTLAPYSCGAWTTFTTPAYVQNGVVAVYAKFVQNVNGNPQGMAGAQAVAIVHWPNGQQPQINERTTSDGLAVFPITLDASAVNHVVLVYVSFTSADGQHTCTTTSPAFFTAIQTSPTPTATPTQQPGGGFPGGPFATQTSTAGGGGFPGQRTPTPTPTATP